MPYTSQQQARWAHATDQPFAADWDTQTDFSTLPKRARRRAKRKEAATVGLAIPPHGPNALFNQPAMDGKRAKRIKKRVKGCTCTTKATGEPGELISPGVRRIRGNLCNVHGRYGPCDTGAAAKPAKGRARKPAKPKAPKKAVLTPEQRASARDAAHTQNQSETLAKLNITPEGQAALQALRAGGQPDPKAIAAGGFEQAGLVEHADDGSYHLTPSGRAALAAAASGDVGRTGDTISGARDRTNARQTRLAAAQSRSAAAQAKRDAAQTRRAAVAKRRASAAPASKQPNASTPKPAPNPHGPSATSGHSAVTSPKAPKPVKAAPAPKVDPAITEARNLTSVADATELGDNLANLNQFSQGKQLRDQDAAYLVSQGLLERAADGTPRQTTQGKAVLSAAKKGDVRGAKDALSRARETTVKAFSVYKDSAGNDRWLSITTSAYEDSDREWISTKAIATAVAVGDLTQQRGPLRYWHVPGMDFGDCDFQAAMGPGDRFLIESGTFRSKAAARFGRTLAERGYQMSPGFYHARNQPQAGVFTDIVLYERSPVPAGRAANPFTRFATQEDRMLTQEKETELKTLLADQPDLLKTLLSQVDQTDKAAQAAGVTHKEADTPPAWFAPVLARLDALEATTKAANVTNIMTSPNTTIAPGTIAQWVPTVKAAPPFAAAPVEGSPEEEASEPPDEAMAEGDDTSGTDENMLTPTEIQTIAAAAADATVAKLMAQLGPLLDLEKKMQGHVAQMVAPLQAQKDDATAKLTAKVEALETSLKNVAQGEFPASLYDQMFNKTIVRPSEVRATPTPADAAKIKEALAAAGAQPPEGLSPAEAGAYTLIYG